MAGSGCGLAREITRVIEAIPAKVPTVAQKKAAQGENALSSGF